MADAGLEFVGLVGMVDPPRPKAISRSQDLPYRRHHGQDDHRRPCGHGAVDRPPDRDCQAGETATHRSRTGALDDEGLRGVVRTVNVFARVEPAQKLRLVRALQANGEVVAMTGDGVNDAPALKQADIGIAMGLAGTEVAKDAADMVLTDDDFAAIEAAVEEGRGVYDNLVKFITWTLPTNFGEGLVIVAAIVAGATLPITPLQILWINMTTAVFLGLMLAFEPIEQHIMRRPPRPRGRRFSTPRWSGGSSWSACCCSPVPSDSSCANWRRAIARRSAHRRGQRLRRRRGDVPLQLPLADAVGAARRPVLQSGDLVWRADHGPAAGLLTYLPLMNRLFATAPIGLPEWLEIFAVGVFAYLVVGHRKAPAGGDSQTLKAKRERRARQAWPPLRPPAGGAGGASASRFPAASRRALRRRPSSRDGGRPCRRH
jgi:cation-transporting ATPase F